ncbi:hypothetical protein C4585_01875 [Candidatus Parcubacteria bacterium]|nr:MAG: hypothetical protein C4585_01875 [Candidatus Parcubacteria bacterium]
MQCVILAAGRGVRMGELTETLPKPMLEVKGKTLLEYKFDALPENIDEIIIVVGHLGHVIQERYGGEYNGKRILYVVQDTLNGTAGALWQAKDLLKDSFIVMNGDDIFAKEDIEKAACYPWSVVGIEVDDVGKAAKIVTDGADRVVNILESDEHGGGPGFLNAGLYCLDMRIFEHTMVPRHKGSDEYGLPQTIVASGVPFSLIKASHWVQITDPADLKKAEEILAKMGA